MQRRFLLLSLTLALGASASLSSGCTLLINGNQYVGNGTDGGTPGDGSMGGDGGDGGGGMNTPPILRGVALDDYRPIVGGALHALPGAVVDAEGNPTTIHYQWYQNGTAVTGMTGVGSAFVTSALAAGDTLRVEAWANDGTVDGPHVSAGPVTLSADVTRWRQLLPNNGNDLPVLVWDEANARVVRLIDGGLWEYVVEGDHFRITQLAPTGTAPPAEEFVIPMPDPGHDRLLVYAPSDPGNLYSLDLSMRGAEVWTKTPVSGSAPGVHALQTVFYDAHSQRVFVVGGFQDSMGALRAINSLDVATPGGESWAAPTTSGDPLPAMFGAAAVGDPTTPGRFYLIGGVGPQMGMSFTMRDHVLQLDVTASDVHVTETTQALPTPSWGAVAAVDPTSLLIYVFGGVTAFGPTGAMPVGLYSYAPTSGTFTQVMPGGTEAALVGELVPHANGHMTAITLGGDIFGNDIYLQEHDVTSTGATRLAADRRPGGIADAMGSFASGTLTITGGTSGGVALQHIWTVDTATWRWQPTTTMDDVVTHHSPAFRYGMVGQPSGRSTFEVPPLFQVGGELDRGVLADMAAFELTADGHWVEHGLAAASGVPAARTGAAVFPVNCGATVLGVYGGIDASNSLLGDAAMLECSSTRSCTWNMAPGLTGGRSFGGLVAGRSHAYVFGGNTSGGPANDIVAIYTCIATPTVDPFTASGAIPSPRAGASFSAILDAGGQLASAIAFGGDDGTSVLADASRLTFDSDTSGTWAPITLGDPLTPAPRAHHLAVWDPVANRLLVIGGSTQSGGTSARGDVWELRIRP